MLLLFTSICLHAYLSQHFMGQSPETGQLDLPTSRYFLLSQEQQEAGQ